MFYTDTEIEIKYLTVKLWIYVMFYTDNEIEIKNFNCKTEDYKSEILQKT